MKANNYPVGWLNGEYHCPCGTIFGKNLLGQSPFSLVYEHKKVCEAHTPKVNNPAPNYTPTVE
jgi:hypothetical protein